MAHAPEEVADMVGIASALVLNIGTLTTEMIEAMKLAAKAANQKGIPVVLDACGVGATKLRDQKVFEILDQAKVDILKGNASEIARIAGHDIQTKGVDAAAVEGDQDLLARTLAADRGLTVVITGQEDIVADERGILHVQNGHTMMTQVVGTGCMATSVLGAFAAVESDCRKAAVSALVCYEVAAELAAKQAAGPASFKTLLFDTLYLLDRPTVEARQKIH
jgi:hydroxyethylthiazole kinase